jgi:hypothetical protein
MDRFLYDAEDRDGLVAELTEQRLRAWNLRLQAGEQRALTDLQNLVLDRLAEKDAQDLFKLAITDEQAAGLMFATLVSSVMRDQCEADADKAAMDMERARAASADEGRVERGTWARAMA